MRVVLLLCFFYLGAVEANSKDSHIELIQSTSEKTKSIEHLDTVINSRLNALEGISQQVKENQQKFNELHEENSAELTVFLESSKSTASAVVDNKDQIDLLLLKYDDLKKLNDSLTQENDGMSFETWAGILLACVAVIVTGLGVVIALLALWGYSNIKKAATEAAVTESKVLVKEAIASGDFNQLIYTEVNKAIYRGILSENDFPETESEGEVNESL